MTIELGHYGFMLDTKFCYIALSWELLVATAVVIVGYKVWRRSQNKF
jgi:hypothetical protein